MEHVSYRKRVTVQHDYRLSKSDNQRMKVLQINVIKETYKNVLICYWDKANTAIFVRTI